MRIRRRTLYKRFENIIYVIIWVIVFVVPFIMTGNRFYNGEIVDWNMVSRQILTIVPYFVIFLLHNSVFLPFTLSKGKIKRYIFLTLSLVILSAIYFYLYHFILIPRTFPHHLPPEKHIYGPFLMDTTIAILLLGFNLSIKLMFDRVVKQHQIEKLERLRYQQELENLKSQVSPHFLMNMLNNIHGMVDLNPEKAQDMILKLSNMMRYILYDSSMKSISLAKEVTFIKNYLSLMRERFSPKKVEIECILPEEDKVTNISVPPLVFIVFIENAFKHGISYRELSKINISLCVGKNKEIEFSCTNSRYPEKKDQNGASGIGLTNIRKRLNLIYGSNHYLDITTDAMKFNVKLKIPFYENQMFSN